MTDEKKRMKNLKEIVFEARQGATESAGRTIGKLRGHAERLGMEEAVDRLEKIGERLASDTFHVIVVGRFNNGKSTLLNALLGVAPGGTAGGFRGPLPTDMHPCTAVLSRIRYAEKPYVRAWSYDGTSQEWSWQQFLDDSMVEPDEQETAEKFQDIRNFEIGYPTDLCKAGVTLIDSPGTDDVSHRTTITREALQRADAAIVLYRSDSLAGQGERHFVSEELLSKETRTFTIINRFNGSKVNKRLKGFTWQRLVTTLRGGERYRGQDLADRDIFFVDALQAERGRFDGDEDAVESSGLALFENRLGEFLVRDRHHIHLQRFTSAATREGAAIEKHITQKRAILQRESRDLEEASEEIRPQLEDIRRRRDAVPEIFSRYRREAAGALSLGFEDMFANLRDRMSWELERTELQTLQGLRGKIRGYAQRKKVVQEAEEAYRRIVNDAIDDWLGAPANRPGARQLLVPILERMQDELEREVGAIEKGCEDVRLHLTGWQARESCADVEVSMTQRVLGVVAGFLLRDVGVAIGGGASGWRGVAVSTGSLFATGLGLALLGISPIGWLGLGVTVLGGIAGGIAGANMGLEKRVKEQVSEALQSQLDGLAEKVKENLEKQVALLFQQIEDEGMAELRSAIEAEEQDIRSMLEANAQTQEEKAKMLRELETIGHEVQDDLRVLRQVDLEAQAA